MNKIRNLTATSFEDDDYEDTQRWLLPYADFITLLFSVFVVMYSVSNVQEIKFKALSDSLAIALNSKEVEKIPEADIKKVTQTNSLDSNIVSIEDALQIELNDLILQDKVRIIHEQNWVSVEINDSLIFKSGQVELEPEFVDELKHISEILVKYPNTVQVEGHTDNQKVTITNHFPSNWELSAARASGVVRCLIENGVPSSRLEAVGLAENHPIDTNETPEGRFHNRRVSLKILAKTPL